MIPSSFKTLYHTAAKKRKGSVQDLFAVAGYIFAFGVTLIVATKLLDSLMANPFFAGKAPMEAAAQSLGILDYGTVFLTIGLFIVSIMLAAQIPANRMFLPISLLTLVVAVFTAGQLGNVYTAIASTGSFEQVANTLGFSTKILYNFPYLIGVGGFLIILALYTRNEGGTRAAR